MVEGFWRIIEAVDDLDDWMDVCVFNEANKALERRTMSHGHALDARATQHERHGAELHVESAEKTDDGNLATRRQRVNRFGKVLATDDLQDMVDATGKVDASISVRFSGVATAADSGMTMHSASAP